MDSLVLDAEWDPRPGYDLSKTEAQSKRAMDASAVWRKPSLSLERRDRPEPGSEEVLIEVKYVGICGSDLSMMETDDDGYLTYSAYAAFPNVPGHEFVGKVIDTGSETRLFDIGDFVTAEVTDYCGRCNACRRGYPGHCDHFEQLGFTVQGALAEYVTVDEKLCWDISPLKCIYDDKDEILQVAATIEPCTIAYHGLFVRADGIVPGDYHIYHGIGPIGLTGMTVSRGGGAGAVIAFEPVEERRAIARDLGFTHVYDPLECDPVERVLEITNGEGGDVHIETSGAVRQTYPIIEETLAEGANIVHISNAEKEPLVDLRKYQGSTAQLYGAEGHTGNRVFPHVIRMMAGGLIDTLPMVTSIFPLSEAERAFEQADKRIDGKVLIEI